MNDPVANLIGVGHVSGSSSGQDYNNPFIKMDANNVQGGGMPIGISSQMLCGNSVLPMQDIMCHKGVDSSFSQLPAYTNQINMVNNHSYPQVFPNIHAVNHGIQHLNSHSMNFENNFQPPVEQNLIFNNPEFSSVSNCPPPVEVNTLNSESYNMFHNDSPVESSLVSNCSVAPHSQFGFSSSLDTQLASVTKSVEHSTEHFSADDLFSAIDTELVQNASEGKEVATTLHCDPLVDDEVTDNVSAETNVAELNHVITEHSTGNIEEVLFQENETLSRVELEVPVCEVNEQSCEENRTSVGNPEVESVGEREESCEEDETLSQMNVREDSLQENETTSVHSVTEDMQGEFEKTSVPNEAMPFPEEIMDSSLQCPQDFGDNVLSGNTADDESVHTMDCRGSDREVPTEENDTNLLSSASEGGEATTVPAIVEEVHGGSEIISVTNDVRHSTEANNDSPLECAQVGSPCNVASEDCESESTDLAKDCLTGKSSNSKESECFDEIGKENDEFVKAPTSPMITMLDSNLGEDDVESSTKGSDSECAPSTSKACSESTKDEILDCVRLTRRKTGALPLKSHHMVEDVAVVNESWQYQESALLAPSTIDPSITIPDNVLRVSPEEQAYYMRLFPNLHDVLRMRLHCTTCGRHIGSAPSRILLSNRHKVLRVLVCSRCRSFYGKGKFTKDSDGSELFCRWCGQGGQVVCCTQCPNVFCLACLRRNLGPSQVKVITCSKDWKCVVCNYRILWHFRAVCWAILRYSVEKKKEAVLSQDSVKLRQLWDDNSTCCVKKKKKYPSQTDETCSSSPGDSSEKLPSVKLSVETCSSSPGNSSEKLPSVKLSVGTCSSSPGDSSEKLPSVKLSLDNYSESFARGHFLFPDGNDEDFATTRCSVSEDESSEIDPSLFVQPVLEEPSPPRPSVSRAPRLNFIRRPESSMITMPGIVKSIRPNLPSPRLVSLSPARFNGPVAGVPVSGVPASGVSASSPRIFVRSPSSLLRPGLVPLSKKMSDQAPKKMSDQAPVVFLNENSVKKTMVAGSGFRGSAPNLSSLDGVRSMEQLVALDSVPWFRNGIDNLRAVGFAITKRLRDLEARFHTLKNKEDSEKVMLLGKKLDRLTKNTSLRFEKISSEIREGCHQWKTSKLKRPSSSSRSSNLDPFVFVEDQDSDWEDSKELNRPLEKVIIPINTAALQGANTPNKLMALAMKGLPANMNHNAKSVPMSVTRKIMPSNMNSKKVLSMPVNSKAMPGNFSKTRTLAPTKSVAPSNVQKPFVRILPKPQERPPNVVPSLNIMGTNGNSLAKMLHNINMVDSVGNSVSITVTNTNKRKREDSDCADEPNRSIQELMSKYNIQPCFVRLKRCDDLVVSSQEQSRIKSIDVTVFDDDDDIQIIEEVDAEQAVLPTVLCATTLCETVE